MHHRRGAGLGARPRVCGAVVAVLVVCALGLLGWTPVASALPLRATTRSLPGTTFDGANGDVVATDPNTDWIDLGLSRIRQKSDPVGPGNVGDDHFSKGSEEDNPDGWFVTTQGALGVDQGDFRNIWWADQRMPTGDAPGAGDAFLYLALNRLASNGSIFLTFELNQRPDTWRNSQGSTIPCRTDGDLLIALDVNGHVGSVHVYEWTGSSFNATGCSLSGSLSEVKGVGAWVEGAFNADPINNPPDALPLQPTTMGIGEFGEVAINLTQLEAMGAGEPCADSKFKSIWAHSESSPSADDNNSEMKDYVGPTLLNVQGCEAQPTLSTVVHPSGTIPAGTPIWDTAILSGTAANPTGKVTFELFRVRRDGACVATGFTSQDVTVGAGGTFNSASYDQTRPGTYSWVVTYSGDVNDHSVPPTMCGDPTETVRVIRATPTIDTLPVPPTGPAGASFRDTATLSGGFNPTGRVRFRLFPPDNPTCTGRPFRTERVDLNGAEEVTSSAVTIEQAGVWHWVATYLGDRSNRRVSSPCDAEPVNVVPPGVTPEVPTFSTTASPGGPVGTAITDTAHLGSTSTPTGSITFELFGPNDPNCTELVADETVPVTRAGNYTSPPVTPTDAGTYRWVATYSGDPTHTPAATGCGDAGESADLSKATPAITTSVSAASVAFGHTVGDAAVLTGAVRPTGTITFRLYGPDDATCSRAPVFVADQHVGVGSDSTPSPTPTPELAGTYRWVATYSGDANNAGASTTCGDRAETFVVNEPIAPAPEPENARLAITKRMPALARVGSVVPITITVRNTSRVAALDVRVTDDPPSGARLQVTASNATHKPNGTVVWVVGTLAPGATRTLHASMRITATAPRGTHNTAIADASNARTVTDSATVHVPRAPAPPPAVTG